MALTNQLRLSALHVVADGNLFVLFGPHIGVDENLQLGKYGRAGQRDSGAACGAAVGALNYCRACCTEEVSLTDASDYQMSFLKAEIKKRMHLINGAGSGSYNAEQAALATQTFEICKVDRRKGLLIVYFSLSFRCMFDFVCIGCNGENLV